MEDSIEFAAATGDVDDPADAGYAAGDQELVVDDRQPAVGDQQPAGGDQQPAVGDQQPAGDDDGQAGEARPESPLDRRLAALEAGVAEFHRRAEHREAVIDRLHAENQELRLGLRRVVLDPLSADLIRLYDSLRKESARRAPDDDGDVVPLLDSLADDVELILDRCGLEPYTAAVGETYRAGTHVATVVRPTPDKHLDNTIVEVLSVGFRDRDSDRPRRPVRTVLYRHRPPAETTTGPDEPSGPAAT